MLHALLSGCPMPVLRPTGPITAFMVDLYLLSDRLEVDYYQLLVFLTLACLFTISFTFHEALPHHTCGVNCFSFLMGPSLSHAD